MAVENVSVAYQRLRNLVDLSPDVICSFDRNGRFLYVSKGCSSTWGYFPEEIIGQSLKDVVFKEDLQLTEQAFHELISGKNAGRFANRGLHKNGYAIPLEWTGYWDQGEEVAYCVARAASEKQQAEIRLEQSEKRFRALVQHSYEMITVIDLQGNYQYNSDSVYRMLGYSPGELIGSNALGLVHPEDLPRVTVALQRLYTESFVDDVSPFRFRNSKGFWLWVEVTGTNLVNDPAVQGVVINARDVTEKIKLQKKLEKQVASHQRKIAAAAIEAQERERSKLGIELHDSVNQVLSTIKLYLEMYLTGSMEDKRILEKATEYTQECINEVRSISRRLSAPTLGNLPLSESVKELVRALNAEGKINVTLDVADFSVSSALHLTLYRIIQEQLTNIIRHAEAKNVTVMVNDSRKNTRLIIKDDGKGFDESVQKKGIGLLSIASRVDSLKGELFIRAHKGKGCELKVILPHESKKI